MQQLKWEVIKIKLLTVFNTSTGDEQFAIQMACDIHQWMQDSNMQTVNLHLFRETECVQQYFLSHRVYSEKEEFDPVYRLLVEFKQEAEAVAFKLRFC